MLMFLSYCINIITLKINSVNSLHKEILIIFLPEMHTAVGVGSYSGQPFEYIVKLGGAGKSQLIRQQFHRSGGTH